MLNRLQLKGRTCEIRAGKRNRMSTKKLLRLFLLISFLPFLAIFVFTVLHGRYIPNAMLDPNAIWLDDAHDTPNITNIMSKIGFDRPSKRAPCRQVPRILHFVWLDKEKHNFRFHHLISVMSALIFFQPETILFWFDPYPRGIWWQRLDGILRNIPARKRPLLQMIPVQSPQDISGKTIYYPEHQSDFIRLKSLLQHGGLYMDLDVVIVNDITPLLCYDFTIREETPEGLCNDFMTAIPGAQFLKIWLEAYGDFQPSIWNYNSVIQPSKLALRNPDLVHVEKSTINHQNWGEEIAYLYDEGKFYDWKKKNYALHLWYRKHEMDYDPESILALNNTLGEVFRYIYYGMTNRTNTTPNSRLL